MKPAQPNPSEPLPHEPISPEIVAWARQTFNEEEFLQQVRAIEATGAAAGRLPRRTRSPSAIPVSTAESVPAPYRVVYSEQVRQRLLTLADVARQRGDGEAFVAAVKEFHRRLCLYPQFGEPLADLAQEAGQVWIGTVRPLAML